MKELDQFTVERLQAFIDKPLDNGFTRYEQMVLAYLALAVKQSEPVAYVTFNGCLINACDPKLPEYLDPQPLYDVPVLNSPEIPDGWVMVPKTPTQKMVIHGFESDAMDALADSANEAKGWPYSCRESAELVTGIFNAMVAVAPKPEK